MMYKIEYTNLAKKDIEKIIFYISHNLKNKKAALNLKQEFMKCEKNILTFPYGVKECEFTKKLKYKYRKIKVKNFYMFYIIQKNSKRIIITRVLYKKRNFEESLQ